MTGGLPPGLSRPDTRLLMIVGAYGSGKTEIAVNLAIQLARSGRNVQIADMDLVNPYFRCREARALMEKCGVRVVTPCGSQHWADLPIVLPEIQGMLHPPEELLTIFDVGGDDVGARSLSAFRPLLREGDYELVQVLNNRRPFTEDAAGCRAARCDIEAASRLRVTGLIANSHLIDETTPDVVLEGVDVATEVGRETGLPVHAVAVIDRMIAEPALLDLAVPVLTLERHMVPPWVRGASPAPETVAAARPRPIGVPPRHS